MFSDTLYASGGYKISLKILTHIALNYCKLLQNFKKIDLVQRFTWNEL